MASEARRRILYKDRLQEEHKELFGIMSSYYKHAIQSRIIQIDQIQTDIQAIQLNSSLSEKEQLRMITDQKEKVFQIAEQLLEVFNRAREGIIQNRMTFREEPLLDKIKTWLYSSIQSGKMSLVRLVDDLSMLCGVIASGVTGYHLFSSEAYTFSSGSALTDLLEGNTFSNHPYTYVSLLSGLFTGGVTSLLLSEIITTIDRIPAPSYDRRHTEEVVDALNDAYQSLLDMIDRVAAERECSICKEEFEPDHPKVYLSCGHSFHRGCILQYIRMRESYGDPYIRCPNRCPGRISSDSIIHAAKDVPIDKLKHSGYKTRQPSPRRHRSDQLLEITRSPFKLSTKKYSSRKSPVCNDDKRVKAHYRK